VVHRPDDHWERGADAPTRTGDQIFFDRDGIVFTAVEGGLDFHITTDETYDPQTMRDAVLPLAEQKGLRLLSEEENPAELLSDGRIRIYLVYARDEAPTDA
jgi:hypothetical protein